MADIKIAKLKPENLPQYKGPLSKLDASSNDLTVVKYPSDLGNATSVKNNKNHWVSFRIYDIEPAGLLDEKRNSSGQATLALPTALNVIFPLAVAIFTLLLPLLIDEPPPADCATQDRFEEPSVLST